MLAEQLQQHFAEPGQPHDGLVIGLHEALYRQVVVLVFIAQCLGHGDLLIEQQPLLAASAKSSVKLVAASWNAVLAPLLGTTPLGKARSACA